MHQIPCICLALLGWFLTGAAARADHLEMELELKVGKTTKTAKGEKNAIGVKPKTRGIIEAKVGQTITVKWTVANKTKKETVKDVMVHFFVVKEEKAGQTTIPKLDKNVPVESALTMDFKPKDKNEGELTFEIDTPGTYLVRLETQGAAVGVDGHEHFAALDLVVK
jgi:hypothetical protein